MLTRCSHLALTSLLVAAAVLSGCAKRPATMQAAAPAPTGAASTTAATPPAPAPMQSAPPSTTPAPQATARPVVQDFAAIAELAGERGERSRQRVHALRERGEAPLGFRVTVAALRLRQAGLRLAERTLGALLHERHVRPELEEILLGGDAGGVLNRRAAAEQQGGEKKGAPSPRHGIQGYRGLTRKCARRFLLQHASLCSVHCGRSSP